MKSPYSFLHNQRPWEVYVAKTIREIEDDIHHFEAELGWVNERRDVLGKNLDRLRTELYDLRKAEAHDTIESAVRATVAAKERLAARRPVQ